MKGNEEKSEKSFSFPYIVVILSSSPEHLPHPPFPQKTYVHVLNLETYLAATVVVQKSMEYFKN